jgi:hypothetical protein
MDSRRLELYAFEGSSVDDLFRGKAPSSKFAQSFSVLQYSEKVGFVGTWKKRAHAREKKDWWDVERENIYK